MSTEITIPQKADIAKLAKECEAACAGDIKAASEMLFAKLQKRPDLYTSIADPMVRAHCWALVGNVRRSNRQAVWNAPNFSKGQAESSEGVRHLSNANRSLMDDFVLPDGTRLGDATREKLVEAAQAYTKQALDMRQKGSFLAMLAAKLTGTKRVRDVLKETDLIALRDRATSKDIAA